VNVLVVEDDPLIREFVVEALREEGFDVVHAADGEEALEWCRRRFADVLITDVRLPGKVDGWQIAERCRDMIQISLLSMRRAFRRSPLGPWLTACSCRSHSTPRRS